MVDSFLRYLEFEKRYSGHTLRSYKEDINQFEQYLSSEYPDETIVSAQFYMIRGWIVSLVDASLAATSINRKISTLRAFYKFLLKREEIKANPMVKIKALKKPSRLPKFVKENEMLNLLDNISFETDFIGKRDQLVLEILYGTGIRLSELLGLKINDVSLQKNELKVLGKRNKERIVPFNNNLAKIVNEYIAMRLQEFPDISHNFLIVTDTGAQGYPVLVYRIVRKYLGQFTTLEKRSPHVLRHTFATHLLNKGAELNAVKELLGHSSLAATQVYTHNSLEKIKDVYRQAHPKA